MFCWSYPNSKFRSCRLLLSFSVGYSTPSAMALLPAKLALGCPNYSLFSTTPRLSSPRLPPFRVSCAKRTGKKRYPSEKKKLKLKHKEVLTTVKNKFEGIWRLFKLGIPVEKDPGKDFLGLSDALMQEIAKVLEFPVILAASLIFCLTIRSRN